MNYLNLSAYGSLLLQFLTGLVETTGLYAKIPEKDKVLQDILTMELIVQAIEFIFYLYLVYKIVNGDITKNITSTDISNIISNTFSTNISTTTLKKRSS